MVATQRRAAVARPRPRTRRRPRTATALVGVLVVCAATLLAGARRAEAIVFFEDEIEEKSLALTLVLRTFNFVFAGRALQPPQNLGDANPSGVSVFDFRHNLTYRNGGLKVVVAGNLTTSLSFATALGGGAGLGNGASPPRWLPLQYTHRNGDSFWIRYQLDRLYLSWALGPVTLAVGRQPVTFGRGQLFKPSDMVSTFALTQVDSEFKPGSDAFRLDWNLGAKTVLTLVAAPAELVRDAQGRLQRDGDADAEVTLAGSSFVGRFKHGFEAGEVGLIGGWVRGDVVVGVDAIFDLTKLDLYAEVVANIFTERSLSPNRDVPGGAARGPVALRGVLGTRFKPTSKLTINAELFYNGFGSFDRDGYLAIATSERFAIGELYTLGRIYAGGVALWQVHPLLLLNAALMANLHDPSGLLSLGAVYNVAGNVSIIAGTYIPMGRLIDTRQPLAPLPRSEFGLYPYFFFFEVKVAI